MPINRQVPAPGQPGGTVVLSPVPVESSDLDAARNYLAAQIGMGHDTHGADAETLSRLDGLMQVAAALVEREAPAAPQAVKNECVIRVAGYLRQSDFGGVKSESSVGGRTVEYFPTNGALAFRNSGAKGMLSPWKRRRARAIG